MVIDRVASALLPSSQTTSDSDQVMSESEDDVGGSLDGEEPMASDDLMTLVQYQSCQRKETLSRKNTQTQSTSHKKGKVVKEREVP